MSVPAGADKKLKEKQAARELERANAKRKHLWNQGDTNYDTFRGVTTKTYHCRRSQCSGVWIKQFNSAFGGGRQYGTVEEPVGCFSPDK